MSETMNTILTRRSIKKYKPDMIPKEIIDEILKAGTYAASGMGKQSPIIIAVTNKKLRDKLSKINAEIAGVDEDPFYGAPVVLIVLADKNISTHVYDGSLVMGNLMLAAHANGIGSRWIHRAKQTFEREEGKEILRSLGIKGEYEGIGNCILGYNDGPEPEAAPRKKDYVYYID
ncbi:nitroreductase [Paratissierella segnis]|jgi:nitroreductase|uniref:Nitroreductase n=1 Tax=Paratissierella segnis TaxID=2763679 RepID=A0A926ESW1_9FIRM|nr:nitroreductase [Paratissierella segnis]MBC8587046.1 nitroreductase [Paratissierella segnis]